MSGTESDSDFESADEGVADSVEEHRCNDGDHVGNDCARSQQLAAPSNDDDDEVLELDMPVSNEQRDSIEESQQASTPNVVDTTVETLPTESCAIDSTTSVESLLATTSNVVDTTVETLPAESCAIDSTATVESLLATTPKVMDTEESLPIEPLEEMPLPPHLESEKSTQEPIEDLKVEGWDVEEDVLNFDEEDPPCSIQSEKPDQATKHLFDRIVDSSQNAQPQTGGWGWGSWGSTLLSTATSSVSSFTSQVGQGLSSVLETSLGVPSPEDLAQSTSTTESNFESASSSLSLTSLVSGVSSLTTAIEKTSSKVLTGGLNTLELLGKTTMDIIQEGDPGLKNKRALIVPQQPNLSDVLREAKIKAEQSQEIHCENKDQHISVCFSTVFDDCQGLVHLEALEMLSSQCDKKVQMELFKLSGEDLEKIKESIDNFKEIVNISVTEDEENENQPENFDVLELVNFHCKLLKVPVSTDNLVKIETKSKAWIDQMKTKSEYAKMLPEIRNAAVTYLAEFCAGSIELIHKVSELLLLDEIRDLNKDASNLSNLVNYVCQNIQIQASNYAAFLSNCDENESKPVSACITDIFLEATNCSSFIQDGLQLTVPIFQFKFISQESQ